MHSSVNDRSGICGCVRPHLGSAALVHHCERHRALRLRESAGGNKVALVASPPTGPGPRRLAGFQACLDPQGEPGRYPGRRPPGAQFSPGKKISISRFADSSESEPWTRFSLMMRARSPRMVPAAASAGLVAPIRFRTTR